VTAYQLRHVAIAYLIAFRLENWNILKKLADFDWIYVELHVFSTHILYPPQQMFLFSS